MEVGGALGEAERVGDPFPFPETPFSKLPAGLQVRVLYLGTVWCHILQGKAVPPPSGLAVLGT